MSNSSDQLLNTLVDGYAIEHNGLCTTVFSAPNYVDQGGNKGAFVSSMSKRHKVHAQPFYRSALMTVEPESTPNLMLSHIRQ